MAMTHSGHIGYLSPCFPGRVNDNELFKLTSSEWLSEMDAHLNSFLAIVVLMGFLM